MKNRDIKKLLALLGLINVAGLITCGQKELKQRHKHKPPAIPLLDFPNP